MTRPTTSASNIFRRAVCPGSERMEEGLPEEDSELSREGTLLHQLDAIPVFSRAKLTHDQRDLLEISADLEEQVFNRVISHFAISADEPFTQGHEETLWVHRGIKSLIPGHCDRWRHYHRRKLLVIIDKKFGYKTVTPAAANYQLRTYACGGAELWPVDHVAVAITQPRLPFDQRVTMAVYTKEDIQAARLELFGIKDACAKPDAPLVAGEDQCRYCKAAISLTCPAFKETLHSGLALIPMPSGEASVALREETITRGIAALADEQLDKVLIALSMAEFIKDPARDEARRRVASGTLTTWKLGKASEVREITDPERAIALMTFTALSREEVMACCDPSLKKLENKLREKTGGTWKAARETVDSTLASVIARKEKKPSLMRVKE